MRADVAAGGGFQRARPASKADQWVKMSSFTQEAVGEQAGGHFQCENEEGGEQDR